MSVDRQGHDAREADAVGRGPVEHRGAHRARLRDERERTRERLAARERGVQAERRAHQAQAVGTEEPHAVAMRGLEQLAFQRGACRAGLRKAGADDDDCGADSSATTLFDDRGHGGGLE